MFIWSHQLIFRTLDFYSDFFNKNTQISLQDDQSFYDSSPQHSKAWNMNFHLWNCVTHQPFALSVHWMALDGLSATPKGDHPAVLQECSALDPSREGLISVKLAVVLLVRGLRPSIAQKFLIQIPRTKKNPIYLIIRNAINPNAITPNSKSPNDP